MSRRLSLVFLVILVAAQSRGEQPARTHDITVDDYFSIDLLVQQQIAPDGKHVAYTLGRWDKALDGRRLDLWVVNCETKKVRRLTFDHTHPSNPRWSADGKTIWFLARRKGGGEKPPLDGSHQVWRVGVEGGEPFAVTRVPGGVHAFDLAPDGDAVWYETKVEKVSGDFAALKKQFKGVDYGHGVGKTSQLWKLDLETWKTEKIIDEGRVIREFSLAPDGKMIASITTPDETVVSFEGQSRVEVFNVTTKKSVVIPDNCFRADAASPYGWLEHLAWSPDGNRLAFNVIFDGYPAEIIIADQKKESWKSKRMTRVGDSDDRSHIRGYGSPIAWLNRDSLFILEESWGRVRMRLHVAPFDGESAATDQRDVVVELMSVNHKGEVALVMNNCHHLPDLFLKEGKVRLTNLNPQADTWKLPQISVVKWKSKDGTPVEGILELPPDYKKGDKLPLIVEIHGGPTTATRFHLQYWPYGRTLLPAKGYALLSPNYRGSTGYGDKFLTDLVGRENDVEVQDILAGVDAMIEKGIADPNRLGVMGWSNGGYLTNCLITKTTRFKAASSGAGIVDTVMEWGANDEPAYAMAFKKGFPWNQADIYKKTSPTYALDKVRTPTLIHVGGSDERCPPIHSRMLYRALKEYVKVPTELLVYPGEPHGLVKYSNRKAKMEWDLAWFDKYLRAKK